MESKKAEPGNEVIRPVRHPPDRYVKEASGRGCGELDGPQGGRLPWSHEGETRLYRGNGMGNITPNGRVVTSIRPMEAGPE